MTVRKIPRIIIKRRQIRNQNQFPLKIFNVDGVSLDKDTISVDPVKHSFKSEDFHSNIPENNIKQTAISINDPMASVFIDIDAIFGPLKIRDYGIVFKDYNLDIAISDRRIACKTEFVLIDGKPVKLKSLTHVYIGSININAGKFSVFYVCPDISNTSNISVTLAYFRNAISKTSLCAKNIVYSYDVPAFCNCIFDLANNTRSHGRDFFFVENYGCKNRYVVNSINDHASLIGQMNKYIDILSFEFVKIDLAVSIQVKNSIVFLSEQFFQDMNIVPNYHLFANKYLANANKQLYKYNSREKILKYESDIFSKVNFYNTIEDILGPARKRSFIPEITYGLLKGNLAGHSPYMKKNSLFKKYNNISKMIYNLQKAGSSSWMYRIEVRTDVENVSAVVDLIGSALNKDCILFYNSSEFFEIISYNALNLMNKIDINACSISNIFTSMVYEYFLIESFLKGCSNLHSLPRSMHVMAKSLFIYSDCVFKNEFLEIEDHINQVIRDEKILTYEKLIDYDKNLDKDSRNTFKKLLSLPKLGIREAAEEAILIYCKEMISKYNLEIKEGVAILKALSYPIDQVSRLPKIHLDLMIIKVFGITINTHTCRFIFRAMGALYVQESGINSEDWLDAIKEVFIGLGLDLIYNIDSSVGKSNKMLYKIMSVNPGKVSITACDIVSFNNTRNNILESLRARFNLSENFKLRVPWSRSDKIRLMAGRNFYLKKCGYPKGVWSFMRNSSLFGMMFGRDHTSLKDGLSRISDCSEAVKISLENSASIWSPDIDGLENIIEDFKRFGIIFEESDAALYKNLYKLDLWEYNSVMGLSDDIMPDFKSFEPEIIPSSSVPVVENNVTGINQSLLELLKDVIKKQEEHTSLLNNLIVEQNKLSSIINSGLIASSHMNNYTKVDDSKINKPSGINSNSELLDESSMLLIVSFLFQKKRYRRFNLDSAIEIIKNSDFFKDSTSLQIEEAINSLIAKNIISKIQIKGSLEKFNYAFNIKLSASKYLNFETLIGYLKIYSELNNGKLFTSSTGRNSISSRLRPKIEDWNDYLSDLITDKVVEESLDTTGKIRKFYLSE